MDIIKILNLKELLVISITAITVILLGYITMIYLVLALNKLITGL